MKKILLFLSFLLMSIGVFGTSYISYNGNTQDASTTISSSNVSNGSAGRISWVGTSCTYSSNRVNIAAGGGITFTASSGYNITKIIITSGSSSTYYGTWTSSPSITPTTSGGVTTFDGLNSNSVTVTTSTAFRCTSTSTIKIYYTSSSSTYTVTYSKNANDATGSMIDSNNYEAGATVTVLGNEFTYDGYTFTNWNTKDDGSGTDYGVDDTFTINANTTLYAQWEENSPTPPTPEPTGILTFELLTDINDLQDGDSIIILDKNNFYALSTNQKTNNRGATNVFNIIDNIIEVTDDSVQIIKAILDNGLWKFNVGDGYLYAAGKNKSENYLRTQSENDNNGKWLITIGDDNVASIVAQGSNSHNVMQYNNSSTLFSCYTSSSQTGIKIYKHIRCDKLYSVLFKTNYTDYDTIYVPSCVKRLGELPVLPDNCITDCNSTAEFVGWSKHEITGNNISEPIDLFNTLQKSPLITDDCVFHAVFANRNDGVEIGTNIISYFHSKYWTDTDNLWELISEGWGNSSHGVQVSVTTSVAGAKTRNIYNKITSVVVTYNTNKTSGGGSINLKIGETVIAGDVDVTKIGGDSVDRNINYIPNNPLTGKVEFTVTCNEKSIYIKSIQINYTTYLHTNYQTYCTDTLKSGSSWNSGTWSLGRSPQSNERAVVLVPVNVDIEHAKAKEIIIGQNSSNTGKITIQSKKGLEVQDTISVYNGTTYHPTTPNDLVLETSPAGNASLIFNNNNGDSATVWFYSIATYPEGGNANWQYIGTTMTELNALYNYYGSWVYKWDDGWKVVHNGDMMQGWVGYCITQREKTYYETSGKLLPTENVVLNIHAPHTVIPNSWTAPIRIGDFDDDAFSNDDIIKTVYFFNTGYDPDGTGSENTTNTTPGTYIAIPISAAKHLDKDSLIPSQQGFFMKTTTDGTLSLNYDKLVRTNGSKDIVAGGLRAPKRIMSTDEPNVMKIYAHGSKFSDRLTILEREDFSTGFDNGWDGDKMSFSEVSPSIYVVNADGSCDEVSAIPDYEGTLLGCKSESDSICHLTFKYDGYCEWYLNDLVTLTSTLISEDSEYMFTPDNTGDIRFIISATPYSNVVTDINQTSDATGKILKYLYHGNLYIIKNNRIFNTIGSLIK